MNRLENSDLHIIRNFIVIVLVAITVLGCATIRPIPSDIGLTKEELSTWGRPYKIIYNPGKYDADELWIYKHYSSRIDRYYLKNGKVVRAEEVAYEAL
jgi:hypothetical protein